MAGPPQSSSTEEGGKGGGGGRGVVSLTTPSRGPLQPAHPPGTQSRKGVVVGRQTGGLGVAVHGQGRWRGAPQQENLQVIEEHAAAALEETLVAQHLGSRGPRSTAVPGTAAAAPPPPPEQPTQGYQHVPSGSRKPRRGSQSLCRGR